MAALTRPRHVLPMPTARCSRGRVRCRGRTGVGLLCLTLGIAAAWVAAAVPGPQLRLPTANRALYEPGGGERFFVGTVNKPWTTGRFGCVRSDGAQMHEGIDIRCLQRDRAGEPADPVVAAADGVVAYANPQPALSNYGKYVLVRHLVDGLELYSAYAHLAEIAPGAVPGRPIRSGQRLGTMGRTANTRQGIAKDRAHLHFELSFFLNDRFPAWYRKAFPGQRNDHAQWNGRNLLGIDPQEVFLTQAAQGPTFSLLDHVRGQTELCRVLVRAKAFPWLRRYPLLVEPNPRAAREGVVGYELSLNYNGLPFRVVPRAAAEVKGLVKYRLLAVNEAEYARHPCRRLVVRRAGGWEIADNGLHLLNLLTFP